MPFISGKRAFLELLALEGVEIMFGNPGTTELPLMDAFAVEKNVRYVLGLQEAAVLAMADGYAQACGKLVAVNVHVAPGLGNAMGMLYDAQKAGSAILVTAGQHDESFNFSEPLLWAELPVLARPLVKWSSEIRRLEDLPRAIHRAAKTALAPPTGPVFLSIPADVLKAEGELELGAPTRVAPHVRPDAAALEAAVELLVEAERPVIIAGDPVAQNDAHAELVALAEELGAPVYAEGVSGRIPFPASHPLFLGVLVRSASTIRPVLDRHDLILSVGADLFTLTLPPEIEPMPPQMPVIHLDVDPWKIGKNYPAAVAIVADPKASLPELTEALARRITPQERAERDARARGLAAENAAELDKLKSAAREAAAQHPIQPLALIQTIAETLPAGAAVVDETISSGAGILRLLKADDPQSYFGLRGGGIGWGLPAAIGVKLALPDRPVVALIGDGSAMYTCQALWTAAHARAAVVFVIFNNSSYRILKQRVHALGGHAAEAERYVGMDLNEPRIDFVGLARALGLAAERATTLPEVRSLLASGLAANAPLLIDVQIARSR